MILVFKICLILSLWFPKVIFFVKSAYCTGLLLARRVLKMLEMDAEYEGNLEVCVGLGFILNMSLLSRLNETHIIS